MNNNPAHRAPWVIGNWKQHKLSDEAYALAAAVATQPHDGLHVGVAPTLLTLAGVANAIAERPVTVFGQTCGLHESGAFTGDVGPQMLADAGAGGVLLGHSERRAMAHETSAEVAAKTALALNAGLYAVVCVGEPLDVRDAGTHESFVGTMLRESLDGIELDDTTADRLIVAYEPVWAIGTGKTATATEAGAMHAALRGLLDEHLGARGARIPLLYGGSVKPTNAAGLLVPPFIDGFLVGGAALDAASFVDIVSVTAKARCP
jgi:triosephosphate isomerase (TIM)